MCGPPARRGGGDAVTLSPTKNRRIQEALAALDARPRPTFDIPSAVQPMVNVPALPGLPDLTPTQQSVLNAIVALADRLKTDRFLCPAKSWAVMAGLAPPDTDRHSPRMDTAVRKLDRATAVLVKLGFLAYQEHRDSARLWLIQRRRIEQAIARSADRV